MSPTSTNELRELSVFSVSCLLPGSFRLSRNVSESRFPYVRNKNDSIVCVKAAVRIKQDLCIPLSR